MASNFGVVAYIKPPSLTGVTQPDLIKFETEYTAYKDKVNNMNNGRDEANKLPIATIKDCMDGPTLHALCIMGKISGATSLEQATAEKVEQWFVTAHTVAPRDLSERIQSALSAVKYKPCKEDPAGAALTFCLDAIKALDKNNASEIMDDPDQGKYLINKLREKLEPDLLRERVRMKMDTWKKEDKGKIKVFQECVSVLAVEVAQNEVARSRLGKKRDHPESPEKRTAKNSSYAKKGKAKGDGDAEPGKTNGKKQKSGSSDAAGSGGAKAKKYTCLNPDCDGNHKMKDCDKTPDDMKKKLLDEYWEKKKSAKVKAVTSDSSDEKSQSPGEGRYHIVIEEKVSAIALGDYGADVSVLPAKKLEELLSVDSSIQVEKLDEPMTMELADNSMKVAATAFTTLTIVLKLPGSNIPVRFRDIKFFIADFEKGEVLLGRPFLKSIGFDLDQHLEQVGSNEDDQEEKQTSTLASARYTGLSYQNTDDDPIELPESLAAGIGSDTKDAIDKAFAKTFCEGLVGS